MTPSSVRRPNCQRDRRRGDFGGRAASSLDADMGELAKKVAERRNKSHVLIVAAPQGGAGGAGGGGGCGDPGLLDGGGATFALVGGGVGGAAASKPYAREPFTTFRSGRAARSFSTAAVSAGTPDSVNRSSRRPANREMPSIAAGDM